MSNGEDGSKRLKKDAKQIKYADPVYILRSVLKVIILTRRESTSDHQLLRATDVLKFIFIYQIISSLTHNIYVPSVKHSTGFFKNCPKRYIGSSSDLSSNEFNALKI